MLIRVKNQKYQYVTESRYIAAFCFQNDTIPNPLRCPSEFAPLNSILLHLYPSESIGMAGDFDRY